MHTQHLTDEEDIEFPKVPSAKQLPGKAWKLNTQEDWDHYHNFI
jgi:hypothetical protein